MLHHSEPAPLDSRPPGMPSLCDGTSACVMAQVLDDIHDMLHACLSSACLLYQTLNPKTLKYSSACRLSCKVTVCKMNMTCISLIYLIRVI